LVWGLLALKPWEVDRVFREHTVVEIDRMIDGALLRHEYEQDRDAWISTHLLTAAGAKTEEGEAITQVWLLGRNPLHRNPLLWGQRQDEANDDDQLANQAALSESKALAFASAGIGVMGEMTLEERDAEEELAKIDMARVAAEMGM
jgi:hypothetical protein